MTKKVETKPAPYNRKRIAWELERTAMGDGYYGSALYAAKELPEATPAVRSLLDRWATGKESGLSDRTNLCAFALQIYAADEESPSAPAASDGGFTAADMMDARQEGRKEAQQLAAERLAEALRPLAALDLTPDGFDKRPDDQIVYQRNSSTITVGDVRRAAAALRDHDKGGGS